MTLREFRTQPPSNFRRIVLIALNSDQMRFLHRFVLFAAIAAGVMAFAQTKAAGPTVASARAFMDKAEAELLKLNILGARAEWVDETYINDDTDLLTAAENDRLIARTTELADQTKAFNGLDLPTDLKRKILLLKL